MSTDDIPCIAKSELEVLSQEIDDEQGFYRVRSKHRVYYLVIARNTYDEDTMCRPYLLIPALPDFPNSEWVTMQISRNPDGSLQSTLSYEALPAVQRLSHHRQINILSLKRVEYLGTNVYEVLFEGRPAIEKIARWSWEIPRSQNETRAYSIISQYHRKYPDVPPIAPRFLGHLIKNGRAMGILLEKIDEDSASMEDLAGCEEVVGKIHAMWLIHGDVNRYNFIIGRSGDGDIVRMVDFEHVEDYEDEAACVELEALPFELAEETGRGGPGREWMMSDSEWDIYGCADCWWPLFC